MKLIRSKWLRRATLSLLLGVATTIAIAWACALRGGLVVASQLGFMIDDVSTTPARGAHWFDVRRTGLRVCIVSTSTRESDGSHGLAWSPFRATPGEPIWTLTPGDTCNAIEALEVFPNARGEASSGPQIPEWRAMRWPTWLPAVPESPSGLLAYGGRGTGWPFVTMRSTFHSDTTDRIGAWRWAWRIKPAGPPTSSNDQLEGCVPLQPVPFAFAASSVMWGSGWFVLLFGPGIARRAVRSRRGACTACGYDRRGLTAMQPCPECGSAGTSPPTASPPAPC